MMEDRHIFREADIIGMTVTGAAIHKTILREIKPTIMIVEEAAEVFESHLISNLTSGCEHLILIGDHKQLKPKPNVYRLERKYNLDISLFERMVRNGIRCNSLQIQHRMRPSIADNVRHIYKDLIDHDSVKRYESIRGISHNTFFIDHRVEEKKDEDHTNYTNEHEIKYLIALCKYLLLQGYNASEITILTTYKKQLIMLKRERQGKSDILNDVRMTTVDDYQGEENDIILLSLVRSNNEGRVGFLASDNRVCVALSRAKKGFYVIGNFKILATASDLWKSIINSINKKGLLGKALSLCCQNHPNDDGLKVENPIDFQKAPEGGCGKLCDIRLDCDHTCEKYCHIQNREHKNIKCEKPCSRKCINGHQCRMICWRQCVCEENIFVTLPGCGHIVLCKCSTDIINYVCKHICKKKLDCGHECNRKCKDPCICMKPVKAILPECGHETTIPCSVRPDTHKCNEDIKIRRTGCGHNDTIMCRDASKTTYCKRTCNLAMDCGHVCKDICGKKGYLQLINQNEYKSSRCPRGHMTFCEVECEEKMKCGHTCKGNCLRCFQGRWHESCDKDCNCDLICGHKCKGKCGHCLPCTKICKRRCRHLVCKRKCIEACVQCTEPCIWQCDHFKCTKLCGEICDRPRCNKPCRKLLSCKHECIGMCGDPCPIQCRKCYQEYGKLGTLIFGNVNLPDARFVKLQDCGHLIECDIMDKYMDTDEGVCLKRCPLCKDPIRTTKGNRYEDIVNRIYNELNDVKKHILQDTELYDTLKTCVLRQSNDTTEVKRSRYDPMYRLRTVFDCRGALNSLNLMAVQHFIKSVLTENEYPLHKETPSFPHARICMSPQHLHETERELKKYFDKCHLENVATILRARWDYDLKMLVILENANDILCNEQVYTEDDREKVQTCINKLPNTPIINKRLLKLSVTASNLDRNNIIRDGGIKLESFYEKMKLTKHESLNETLSEIEILDGHVVQQNIKESCILTKETTESDQLPCQTHAFLGKHLESRDFSKAVSLSEDNEKRKTTQEELLQVTDSSNDNKIERPDSCQLNESALEDFGLTGTEHIMCEIDTKSRQLNDIVLCKENKTAECETSLDEHDISTVDRKEILCGENDCLKKNACYKECLPTYNNEESAYILKLLTWSGYPYYHCKQSQFPVRQTQSSNSSHSNKNKVGHKRRSIGKYDKEPVQKKSKSAYGNTSQIQAMENKRRQCKEKDDGGPQSKKRKYGETRLKTDTKSQLKRNDTISEIEQTEQHKHGVHDAVSVSKETDTRKVQIKSNQLSSKLITTGKETCDDVWIVVDKLPDSD